MDFSSLVNRRTVYGAIGITLTLLCLFGGWVWWTQPTPQQVRGSVPVALTLIPLPSDTPYAPPTATVPPLGTPTPMGGDIPVGSYVQISGTEGEGLRLRSGPGLSGGQLFLGYDSEVFQVRDGPQSADGFVWYYLVAPYDEKRAGWAASNYLAIIPPPE
jgi:hypothetical protein